MLGVEIRPRVAASARAALGADAEIVQGDARTRKIAGVRAVLLFDVLHLMSREEQDAMLAAMALTLDREGVMLVREADAAAGWRFLSVRIGNTLKALAVGVRGQRFHFRTRAEWLACFARHGFHASVQSMGEGTPFANLLFSLTVVGDAVESSRPRTSPA